jgi:uncharacterized protein with FMN-binding domain
LLSQPSHPASYRNSFVTVDQPQRSTAWKAWLVHSVRVLLLAAILGLIHRQQCRFNAAHEALPQIPLQKVQALFPTATRLQPAEAPGTLEVLDGQGTGLGRVLQTAPDSDPFRGFSGPTNLLIAVGGDDRIVGVSVLSSRDTRDHVALIERDPQFVSQWVGLTSQEAARANVDGVTGATLTSLAIVQGLQKRLGAATVATKFPQPLTVEDAQKLFPSAAAVTPDVAISSLWHASDAAGQPVGSVLRTSPAADEIVGYQGPTESRIGIALDGSLTAVTVGVSFDNEPYVTYVRDDDYFRSLFAKNKLPELAQLDLQAAGVEGVSGATMTSLAVARSLVKAAADLEQQRSQAQHTPDDRTDHTRTILSVAIIALGLLLGLTRLKGVRVAQTQLPGPADRGPGPGSWGAAVTGNVCRLGSEWTPSTGSGAHCFEHRRLCRADRREAEHLLFTSVPAWGGAATFATAVSLRGPNAEVAAAGAAGDSPAATGLGRIRGADASSVQPGRYRTI